MNQTTCLNFVLNSTLSISSLISRRLSTDSPHDLHPSICAVHCGGFAAKFMILTSALFCCSPCNQVAVANTFDTVAGSTKTSWKSRAKNISWSMKNHCSSQILPHQLETNESQHFEITKCVPTKMLMYVVGTASSQDLSEIPPTAGRTNPWPKGAPSVEKPWNCQLRKP